MVWARNSHARTHRISERNSTLKSSLNGLRHHFQEVLHLADLDFLVRLLRHHGRLLLCRRWTPISRLPQIWRELQRVDATTVVPNDDDGFHRIEGNMRELGPFD